MVSISKGDSICITDSKSGSSSKGDYFMFKVKAEKGKGAITIWSKDGEKFSDGETVIVSDILEVKKGARKYQEKWYDTYDVTAKLTSRRTPKPPAIDADFTEIEDDSGDLPF
jgi:hypothetical protein